MATKYIVNNLTGQTIDGDLNITGTITGEYKQNVQDTILDGIDTGTTSVLIYGVNVIVTANTNDFCTRLPLTPVKGKKVTVINTNTSGVSARIFPSVDGGKINGVVDGYFDVPPDSLPYDFVCYENPNPGYWGTSQRSSNATNTITYDEWTISHVSGVTDNYVGTDNFIDSFHGAGTDGNGNLYLIPSGSTYWKSLDVVANLTKIRVYTNIVEGDIPFPQNISVYLVLGYKNVPNGSTTTQVLVGFINSTIEETNNPPNQVAYGAPVGLFNTPPNIGDTGTYTVEILSGAPVGLAGTNPVYSRFYFIFGVDIHESAVTKDYKFRFEIEYI